MNDEAHIIVSSAPRSGSTPLAQLLGQQKTTFVTNELGLYDDWDNPIKWRNFIHSKEWINFVANKNIFEAHGLDLYEFRDDVIRKKLSGKGIYRWIKRNTNVELIGDKCPITYINNMPLFANKFPNAKFIIVLRDGRDVVASQIRGYHKWPPGDPDHADHWMYPTVEKAQHLWLRVSRGISRVRSHLNAMGGSERCFVFKYEYAALKPDEFCEKLSDFLGVEISNINDYFRPTRIGSWAEEHPDMMERLSWDFKRELEHYKYI